MSTNYCEEEIYIVTGSNSGLGKETVNKLIANTSLSLKRTIVVACRNLNSAQESIRHFMSILPLDDNVTLTAMEVDLSDLTSVKNFATDVTSHYKRIHCLVCNAGVMIPNQGQVLTSRQGFEMNTAVNYLGHFLLIQILLKSSQVDRIVLVSSTLLRDAKLNLDLLQPFSDNEETSTCNFYSESKLMMALLARELDRRINTQGQLSVFCVSPGWCKTNLHRNSNLRWFMIPLTLVVAAAFMKSAQKGCQSIFHCATADLSNLTSGKFYRNEKIFSTMEDFLDHFGTNRTDDLWKESLKAVEDFL